MDHKDKKCKCCGLTVTICRNCKTEIKDGDLVLEPSFDFSSGVHSTCPTRAALPIGPIEEAMIAAIEAMIPEQDEEDEPAPLYLHGPLRESVYGVRPPSLATVTRNERGEVTSIFVDPVRWEDRLA